MSIKLEKLRNIFSSLTSFCFFIWIPLLNLLPKLVLGEANYPILHVVVIFALIMWTVVAILLKSWRSAVLLIFLLICYFNGDNIESIYDFTTHKSFFINIPIIAIIFLNFWSIYPKLNKPFKILLIGIFTWIVLISIFRIILPNTTGIEDSYSIEKLLIRFLIISIVSLPLFLSLLLAINSFHSLRLFAPFFYALSAFFFWELLPISYGLNLATNITAIIIYVAIAFWLNSGLKFWFSSEIAKYDVPAVQLNEIFTPLSYRVIALFSSITVFFLLINFIFLFVIL